MRERKYTVYDEIDWLDRVNGREFEAQDFEDAALTVAWNFSEETYREVMLGQRVRVLIVCQETDVEQWREITGTCEPVYFAEKIHCPFDENVTPVTKGG